MVICFQTNKSFIEAACALHVGWPTVIHSVNLYTSTQLRLI